MDYMLSTADKKEFVAEFRDRLEKGVDLPPLPEVAQRLLLLRNQSEPSIARLTEIINKDPGLATQVVHYARLSKFGYGERIKTVDDAVMLVLGYNKALHMATGLSAGRALQMPTEGPLGRPFYWDHSLHSAILTQSLSKELPEDVEIDPGMSYLAGLTHDIGYLLLGHLYPIEFNMLNQLMERYDGGEKRELEFQCLGISHDMIGLCLMKSWGMPEEIIVAVGEHHFPDYGGKCAVYSKLVFLANQLTEADKRGCADRGEMSRFAEMTGLNLSEQQIERAMNNVRELSPEVSLMAVGIAA
ncbi:HDOD domain-containing protein [Pseudomonadota bacterium]